MPTLDVYVKEIAGPHVFFIQILIIWQKEKRIIKKKKKKKKKEDEEEVSIFPFLLFE